MKVYVSADIEGVTGIGHDDETSKGHSDYGEFRQRMTGEVAAACRGALNAGATDIVVKDAHGDGRNLVAEELPEQVTLIRGWSGHPLLMVQEIDESFTAAVFIGYHSRVGSGGNPLAHTLTARSNLIRINDRPAAEFLIYAYAVSLYGVAFVFVSGDEALCEDVRDFNPQIRTFATMRGVGDSTLSAHPARSVQGIEKGVEEALRGDLTACRITLPDSFRVEIDYRQAMSAYRASFFPGASLTGTRALLFETDDYFEVLRLLSFVV